MFRDPTLVVGANAMAAHATHASIHTDADINSAANESTAARIALAWAVDGDADMTSGPLAFTGGAAGGPALRVGYWDDDTAGNYCGGQPLTGDTTFNSAGELTIDSITENGSSSNA